MTEFVNLIDLTDLKHSANNNNDNKRISTSMFGVCMRVSIASSCAIRLFSAIRCLHIAGHERTKRRDEITVSGKSAESKQNLIYFFLSSLPLGVWTGY